MVSRHMLYMASPPSLSDRKTRYELGLALFGTLFNHLNLLIGPITNYKSLKIRTVVLIAGKFSLQ